jgi:hypothetical protein
MRLGGVSGGRETQGWRDSSHTPIVGAGKFGSAKLIFIPSIAAALALTLLAITAVHRIKRPKVEPAAIMPDEALAFFLGPLVQTLRQEMKNAIAEAMKT